MTIDLNIVSFIIMISNNHSIFIFSSIVVFWLSTPTYVVSQNHTWLHDDTTFDCIVGISTKNNVPISQGIIVTVRTIITSANPLNSYMKDKGSIKLYAVRGRYNESTTLSIKKIEGNQVNRESVWVHIGQDRVNSPIHDIVLIILDSDVKLTKDRGPVIATFPFSNKLFEEPVPTTGWIVAGFGYSDLEHIQGNTILEVTNLAGTLTDCDEWFPREWGHFICISNEENLPGVPSGGPLFHEDQLNVVFGLGCFSLRKGNESILVFTNLKLYRYGLRGFIHSPSTTTTKKPLSILDNDRD